jgi:hypothetical protein
MLKKYRIVKPHFGTVMQQSNDRRGLTTGQLAAGESRYGVDGVPYADQ